MHAQRTNMYKFLVDIFFEKLKDLEPIIPAKTGVILTFKILAVSLRTIRFNIQKFYMVLALRRVFCTDLRTDSDFCFIRH